MKNLILKFIGWCFVLMALVSCSGKDRISFTWDVSSYDTKEFNIAGTDGGTLLVDWGDGVKDEWTMKGDSNLVSIAHQYAQSGPYPVHLTVATGRLMLILIYKQDVTTMDVSNNKNLKWLDCPDNQLTSLDVSNNKNLEMLDCSENQLISLDVSKNKNLKILYCSENQLTSLDVSKNKNLESLLSDFDWLNERYNK